MMELLFSKLGFDHRVRAIEGNDSAVCIAKQLALRNGDLCEVTNPAQRETRKERQTARCQGKRSGITSTWQHHVTAVSKCPKINLCSSPC
eukprot:CAMPEP_0172826886 /NCGR_PEP_ID=MMETSP1075-20121228/19733_1 /TAXON_ID=2916 /ORGANISM="Ceratium fusus, Strain PA161109" /LENGTH=89 /DNA_ID=CAMNT_0013668607 /DNA_START=195 /DNA_END=461 /DNA_ORIENTATION=-